MMEGTETEVANQRPVKLVTRSVPSPTGDEHEAVDISLLQQTMTRFCKHPCVFEVKEGIETLNIYCRNLYEHPHNVRFRIISSANANFRDRLGHLPFSSTLLHLIGYNRNGSQFLLQSAFEDETNHDALRSRCLAIQETLEQHRSNVVNSIVHYTKYPKEAYTYSSVLGVGLASRKGRRQQMEDEEAVIDKYCDDPGYLYCGLYDGHGGRDSVENVVLYLHQNIYVALLKLGTAPRNSLRLWRQNVTDNASDGGIPINHQCVVPTHNDMSSLPVAKDEYLAYNAAFREAFRVGYLQTDAQLSRSYVVRSGTTSVSVVVRSVVEILPEDASTTDQDNSNNNKNKIKTGNKDNKDNNNNNKNTDDSISMTDNLSSDSNSKSTPKRRTRIRRFLHVANVGDSRAILCRNGIGYRLTVDHKATLPSEQRRVIEAGGFISSSLRVNGILAITRALGDHVLKDNDVVCATPYTETVELIVDQDFHDNYYKNINYQRQQAENGIPEGGKDGKQNKDEKDRKNAEIDENNGDDSTAKEGGNDDMKDDDKNTTTIKTTTTSDNDTVTSMSDATSSTSTNVTETTISANTNTTGKKKNSQYEYEQESKLGEHEQDITDSIMKESKHKHNSKIDSTPIALNANDNSDDSDDEIVDCAEIDEDEDQYLRRVKPCKQVPYTGATFFNGDFFVLLACDGIWDVLSDQVALNQIQLFFREYYNNIPKLRQLRRKIDEANVGQHGLLGVNSLGGNSAFYNNSNSNSQNIFANSTHGLLVDLVTPDMKYRASKFANVSQSIEETPEYLLQRAHIEALVNANELTQEEVIQIRDTLYEMSSEDRNFLLSNAAESLIALAYVLNSSDNLSAMVVLL